MYFQFFVAMNPIRLLLQTMLVLLTITADCQTTATDRYLNLWYEAPATARSLDDSTPEIPPAVYKAEFEPRTIDGITNTFARVDADLQKELGEGPNEPPQNAEFPGLQYCENLQS